MTTLTCSRCGVQVARVRDTRFGLAPESCVCRACASPAYLPLRLPA